MANGGYVSGCAASGLGAVAEATLRAPTPLEVELTHEQDGHKAALRAADGALLVEASALDSLELALPRSVSFDEAQQASGRFVGFHEHPYPGCFVCGTRRTPELGAGLALFPGAVEGDERLVAAPFCPAQDLCDEQGLLRNELVWASLDCPSWFGHAAFLENPPKILLGRLAVRVLRRPSAFERCVVHGFSLGQEGRRILCGSALAGADGAFVAYGRATWIELKSA
jgi:hypothetical protein